MTLRQSGMVVLAAAMMALAGCTEEKSFVAVTVRTTEGELANIAQFLVRVWNGTDRRDRLFYPRDLTGKYRISATETIDFSVSFSTSLSGTIRVGVQPLDADARSLGYGELERPIDPGHTVRMTVAVVRGAAPPPDDERDAGTRPETLGDSRSVCEPASPAAGCGAGRTCYVGCFGAEAVALCTPGGARKAGESCSTNADCEPGTQCLGLGCGSVCVRHCRGDADCGGGRCNRAIPCGGQPSSFNFCTQPCDPRASAASGCTTGLGCFFFADDVVACDCPGPRRMAEEGTNCNDLTDCKPGLVCVGAAATGSAPVCRPVCKLSDNDCAAGRTCRPLRNPDYSVWGACLPNTL